MKRFKYVLNLKNGSVRDVVVDSERKSIIEFANLLSTNTWFYVQEKQTLEMINKDEVKTIDIIEVLF